MNHLAQSTLQLPFGATSGKDMMKEEYHHHKNRNAANFEPKRGKATIQRHVTISNLPGNGSTMVMTSKKLSYPVDRPFNKNAPWERTKEPRTTATRDAVPSGG